MGQRTPQELRILTPNKKIFKKYLEQSVQQILIISGIILILVGFAYPHIKKIPFGQLPGDIFIQSGNSSFAFPIVTCIVISIILSFVFNFFK